MCRQGFKVKEDMGLDLCDRGTVLHLHLAYVLLLSVCMHVLPQASSVGKCFPAVVEWTEVLPASIETRRSYGAGRGQMHGHVCVYACVAVGVWVRSPSVPRHWHASRQKRAGRQKPTFAQGFRQKESSALRVVTPSGVVVN
jgi:hypothetical protein